MPNRIIKESICTSETIDQLSWFEEVMFYRLLTIVDDKGRTDARPKILKAYMFPLKDVRPGQIEGGLKALVSAELVDLYEVDGKPFLQIATWDKHQRIRNVRSKFPGPDGSCDDDLPQSAADCGELPQTAANGGESRLARAQNPNPNPNTNPNPKENNKRARARETSPTSDAFDRFWDEFPKKTGDIRQAYQEYLFAIEDAKPEELLEALRKQVEAADEDDLKYFHGAAVWLRNREWKKPVTTSKKKPVRKFEPTVFEDI